MAAAVCFICAGTMGMLANYHADALFDQKPAHFPEARTRKRIEFSAIMKQDDRNIDGVHLALQCSGALNQIERVCAGTVFGRNGPFLLGSAQEPDPQRPCFHDEHSPRLYQISARTKSLDARSSAGPKSVFQPWRAVIQNVIVRQPQAANVTTLDALDRLSRSRQHRPRLGDGTRLLDERTLQIYHRKISRLKLVKQIIEQAVRVS